MIRLIQYVLFSGPRYTTVYESNFSAGTDGWAPARATAQGNQDGIGGENDCLKVYASADNGTHLISKNAAVIGKTNRVTFRYFIPSGQTNVTGLRVQVNTSEVIYNHTGTLDEWVTVSFEYIATHIGLAFFLRTNVLTSFIGANSPDDDRIFIKDVKVETKG